MDKINNSSPHNLGNFKAKRKWENFMVYQKCQCYTSEQVLPV